MLLNKEISFVVQGPEFPSTKASIHALRETYPGSEIVWGTTDLNYKNVEVDTLVQIPDPGGRNINVHRQCATTLAGIRASTRRIVVKLRSDFILTKNLITDVLHLIDLPVFDHYKCFARRILVNNLTTVWTDPLPEGFWNRCFQISDWFMAGYKEDVRRLFEGVNPHFEYPGIAPEQILWVAANNNCERKGVWIEEINQESEELRQRTEEFIASNLIIMTAQDMGFNSHKYKDIDPHEPGLMHFGEWMRLYWKYKLA